MSEFTAIDPHYTKLKYNHADNKNSKKKKGSYAVMAISQNRGKSTIYKPLGARPRKTPEHDYSQGVSEVARLNDRGNIEVMRANEVAALLQVSTWMVYELVKSGELPHFRVGRSVRFIRADVVGWMLR